MNEKNNIPVIRRRDGCLMFPTWRTQAIGSVRRQIGNVIQFPPKRGKVLPFLKRRGHRE